MTSDSSASEFGVPDELTIWVSPGVIDDPARPDIGEVAVVLLVPAITAHRVLPAGESIDILLSGLLEDGFGLLTSYAPASLLGLPMVADWSARIDLDAGRLLITTPGGGSIYDGGLGPAVPHSWHTSVRQRDTLVVIAGTAVDLGLTDRVEHIEEARSGGRLVAARVALEPEHTRNA